MPRYHRSKSTTRRRYSKKRAAKYRSVNKYAQRKQIRSVARQVRMLRAQSRKLIKLGSAENSKPIANPVTVVEFTDLTKLTRIFDDTGASYESTKSKLYLDKLNVDMKIHPATEWSQVDMTLFIVSLKPASARDVLNDTNNMTTFQNEVDYWDWSNTLGVPHGHTLLNLRRFNVHMIRRISTGRLTTVQAVHVDGSTNGGTHNFAAHPDSGYEQQHRIYKKLNLVGKNWAIKNSTGPWTALDNNTMDPTSRLWLLIFNNNYSTDGEYPVLDYTNMITAHEM